jgi:murein DD-endopeptidase MepM/ murein hydrolase activator NlpD
MHITYKKLLVFIIIFSTSILFINNAYALQVLLSSKSVKPGDVFMVFIKAEDIPIVKFNNTYIPLRRETENEYVGFIAIDLNTTPGKYFVDIKSNNKEKSVDVNIEKYSFKVIHLNLPKEKVFLAKKDLIRAEKEGTILREIFKKINPPLWDGPFYKPLDNSITTDFGVKRIMNKKQVSFHKGIDIRGKTGDKVCAINKGRIVLAQNLFFGGNTIIIDHGQGIYSIYMHLSKINISKGEIVKKGQLIGLVGATGRATGPHLHFGVKIAGLDVNPLSLFGLNLNKIFIFSSIAVMLLQTYLLKKLQSFLRHC